MAGIPGKSGRKPTAGKIYRFDFYYRLIPGEDPPELEELLQSIIQARGRKRRDIIRAALLGGLDRAQKTAAKTEDSEAGDILNDMIGNFL